MAYYTNEEWDFVQTKDDSIYIEKISKTKIWVTTNLGEVILENFDYDKAKLLIDVVSSSGLKITNIRYGAQYEYNVWIEFIISPWTLTCILGYVIILLFSNKFK